MLRTQGRQLDTTRWIKNEDERAFNNKLELFVFTKTLKKIRTSATLNFPMHFTLEGKKKGAAGKPLLIFSYTCAHAGTRAVLRKVTHGKGDVPSWSQSKGMSAQKRILCRFKFFLAGSTICRGRRRREVYGPTLQERLNESQMAHVPVPPLLCATSPLPLPMFNRAQSHQ